MLVLLMRTELRGLTGIRAFAAIGVVLFHLVGQYPGVESDSPLIRVFRFGSNGVDLFFILSGFIIAYSYEREFTRFSLSFYLGFLRKRLARIYPAHLFGLLLMLALGLMLTFTGAPFLQANPAADFLSQLLLVSNWNPLHDAHLAWNVPDWSISSEWLAYLLFPLFLLILRPFPWRFLPLLILAPLVLMASSYALGQRNFGLIRILCEFPSGVALYFFWRGLSSTRIWSGIGLACAAAYVLIGVKLGLNGVTACAQNRFG